MAKVTHLDQVVGKTATEIYTASLTAFTQIGFEIWKERPMAWLAMARKDVDGKEVNGNLAARMTSPASYTLTITSEFHSEEELAVFAESFVKAINELLID